MLQGPDDPARAEQADARERLSYRTLDVEQIGSVYETVMGFTAQAATEPMIALGDEKGLPTFVGLDVAADGRRPRTARSGSRTATSSRPRGRRPR